MAEEYKSLRKIAEEMRAYRHKRFEEYMQLADTGELPRNLAIIAFTEELEFNLMGVSGGESVKA